MTKRVHNLLFILILSVAFCLRFCSLGKIPTHLYIDEVAIGVDAASIAQTGRDIHGNSVFSAIFPSYGDYKLPVYIWLAAVAVKICGTTEFAVRLPSAIAGIWTVFLLYYLTKEFFSTSKHRDVLSLSIAGVAAILPWSLLFSRTGFEGHVGQALVLTALFVLCKAKGRPFFYLLAGGIGALATYTYFSVRFVFPPIYIAYIILFAWKKKISKKTMIYWLFGMAVFAIALLPMMKSQYYNASTVFRLSAKSILSQEQYVLYTNALREYDHNSLFSRIAHHRVVYMAKALAMNYAAHFDFGYVFLHGDANLRHSTTKVGLMYLSFVFPFGIGLYALARRHQRFGLFLLVWYVAALLPASVPMEVPHALRSINGLGVLCFVVGLGIVEGSLWLKQRVSFFAWKMVMILAFMIVLFECGGFIHDYVAHYPARSAQAWFDGWKEAAQLVHEKKKHMYEVIVMNDQLFLWILFYGKYNYADIQHLPSVDFRKKMIENIRFDRADFYALEHGADHVYIVGLFGDFMDRSTEQLPSTFGFSTIHGMDINPYAK